MKSEEEIKKAIIDTEDCLHDSTDKECRMILVQALDTLEWVLGVSE